jgi:hypothetical protein
MFYNQVHISIKIFIFFPTISRLTLFVTRDKHVYYTSVTKRYIRYHILLPQPFN